MIVSIYGDEYIRHAETRHASEPNWEMPVVKPDGSIKTIQYHPLGISSPHVDTTATQQPDGSYAITRPQLNMRCRQQHGWVPLEELYANEGRLHARDRGVKDGESTKTFQGFCAYRRLRAAGKLPRVKNGKGRSDPVEFPHDCLPDAVIDLARKGGALTPEEAKQWLSKMVDDADRSDHAPQDAEVEQDLLSHMAQETEPAKAKVRKR